MRVGRPGIIPSYGIVAAESGSGLLPWSFVEERMASARNFWIGSTRPDGRPHAAPVWGLWFGGVFYFSSDPRSRKGRNLDANPAVIVHLESGDDVVMFEGRVERVDDAGLLVQFADAYEAKYQYRPDPSQPGQAVYALRPTAVFAWLERDYPGSATRWLAAPQ